MTAPSIEAVTAGSSIFDVPVNNFQSGVTVANGKITGTLTKTNAFASPWGEGYFLAMKAPSADVTEYDYYVGMEPSVSSGFMKLDADKDWLMKVTDKTTQKFVIRIVQKGGAFAARAEYDLSELTLST